MSAVSTAAALLQGVAPPGAGDMRLFTSCRTVANMKVIAAVLTSLLLGLNFLIGFICRCCFFQTRIHFLKKIFWFNTSILAENPNINRTMNITENIPPQQQILHPNKYDRSETDNGNRATPVPARGPSPSEINMNMKSERDRLKTFEGWPCAFMDPKDLAKAGFYYIHVEDVVRCAFCLVEIGRWEAGDNAMTDHQRWSNNCAYLCGADVGNIPLDPNDTVSVTRASQDTCGRYGIEIRPNSVAERSEQTSVELSKLGISQHRGPVYPNYSTKESRLRTYKEWPRSMKQEPDELSDAGFFYTGKGDQTVCFSCGGGLKDWDECDDPWEQHAKWFSKCSYVSMVKGRPFITEVASRLEPIITSEQGAQLECEPSCSKATTSSKSNFKERPQSTPRPPKSVEEKLQREQVSDGRLCKICYTEELGVVFLPCGHIVACVKCAPSLDTCAVCRQPFVATVRAFLS